MPFIIAHKNKVSWNKPNQGRENLYSENFKTLKKKKTKKILGNAIIFYVSGLADSML